VSASHAPLDPITYDPPERIISLTPSNTEILFALGAGDRLVGVSEYCDYPAEALALPKVSRFVDADEAAIIGLRPDLVVTSSHLQKAIVERLIERDVTVLAFNPTDLAGIFRDILLLGRIVGALERARALVGQLRARVDHVVASAGTLPNRPKVYLEEWGKPLIPAGWWLADFIELAGGAPALPSVDRRQHSHARVVEPEAIRRANPDVIVVSWPGVHNDVPRKLALRRPEWQEVAAVRHGRVHPIDDWLLHRPGPRVVEGLEAIAQIVAETARAMAERGDVAVGGRPKTTPSPGCGRIPHPKGETHAFPLPLGEAGGEGISRPPTPGPQEKEG
jgi:iron complex transport system substrate-binding protein